MAFLKRSKNIILLLISYSISLNAYSVSLDQVKIAFIFNFANYIHWPASAFQTINSPFTICLETDEHLNHLMKATVENEYINDRRFKVIALSKINEIESCQIIYLSQTISPVKFTVIPNNALLWVSDRLDFARQGGMIELQTQKNNQLKLLINYSTIKKSQLKIQASLLNLATLIE